VNSVTTGVNSDTVGVNSVTTEVNLDKLRTAIPQRSLPLPETLRGVRHPNRLISLLLYYMYTICTLCRICTTCMHRLVCILYPYYIYITRI
jgi:hypothetical protein